MKTVLLPYIFSGVLFDVIQTGDGTYPYRLVVSQTGDSRQPYAAGLELQSTSEGFVLETPKGTVFDINGLNVALNGSFFINQAWGLTRQLEFVVRS